MQAAPGRDGMARRATAARLGAGHGVVGGARWGGRGVHAPARRQGRSRDRPRHARPRPPLLGRWSLRAPARDPRRPGGRHLDGGRRDVDGPQVHASGRDAAADRRGRPARGDGEPLQRRHRCRLRARRPRVHRRRLRQRADPRIHDSRKEGARVGKSGFGPGPVPSSALDRRPARRSTSPIERTGESSSSIWRASTWTSSPSARRTLSRWRAALCGPRFTPWISPRHHPDGS